MTKTETSGRVKEVALLFFWLGVMSFGGPAAYIAIMHREVVIRRKWIDDQRFLDILGATHLIPGPNATEIASHLGLIRAGWSGFIAAGVLFILPGFLTTVAAAWAYVTYGYLPAIGWVLYGVKPVLIAIVVQALWSLGKTAIKSPLKNPLMLAIIGAGFVLYLFDFNEIAILFAGAAIMLLVRGVSHWWESRPAALPSFVPLLPTSLIAFAERMPFSNSTLFLTFLKIGATLYGSGYVLLAFLKAEFVVRLGWLTNTQILDAIAIDQLTPGPVFTTAAFIGYLLSGWPGAILANLGIFLPSFFFVAILSRFMPYLRKTWWAAAFLDGVSAASLGLIAAVAIQLGQAAMVDVFTIILALTALFLLLRFKVNSIWPMLGGGALGVAYKLLIIPLLG